MIDKLTCLKSFFSSEEARTLSLSKNSNPQIYRYDKVDTKKYLWRIINAIKTLWPRPDVSSSPEFEWAREDHPSSHVPGDTTLSS